MSYNGYTAVLVRYPSAYGSGPGEPALWVTAAYLAGYCDTPDTYTINDTNDCVVIGADEDVEAAIDSWKEAVVWEDA